MESKGIKNRFGEYTCQGAFFALGKTKKGLDKLKSILEKAINLDDVKIAQGRKKYIQMKLRDLSLDNIEGYREIYRNLERFLNQAFANRRVGGSDRRLVRDEKAIKRVFRITKINKSKLIVNADLYLKESKNDYVELPPNLVVNGFLDLSGSFTTYFNPGLKVKGALIMPGQIENKLPDDIYVGGNITLDHSLVDQAIELKKKGQIKGQIIVV